MARTALIGGVVGLVCAAPAGAARDDEAPPLPPPSERVTTPFALGAGAGYAFRLGDDGRNHGGAAHVYGDMPLLWNFGLRLEADLLAWGASPDVDRPLLHALVAPSLIYALDDTEAVALVGIGGFVSSEVEIDDPQPPAIFGAGVLLTIGVRYPVWPGVDVEAAVRVPFVLWRTLNTPDDFLRASVTGSGGVVIVPVELWQSLQD